MSRTDRLLIWIATAAVTVSGAAFGVMKYLMTTDDPYAVVNHPLQPAALKLHVLAAPLFVFAIGRIYAGHIRRGLRSEEPRGRRSGQLSWLLVLPMVASGYLIQVATDPGRRAALAWAHSATALVFVVGFAVHQIVGARDDG